MSLRVAICITTHNRRAELDRTLAQIAALDPQPDEVLIVADGCTDGTTEFVRERRPDARLIVHEQGRGSIPSRNEMATATACEIFLSLDDDSHPIEPAAIARIRELFEKNARLAVAAFPQRSDEYPETLTAQDFGSAKFTGSYANSGAAIRASAFRELGGYPDFFFHAYEEPDFALRCVNAGWQVRFEPCVTVRHHYSALERNEIRTHQRHARNELWSVLLRCPMPQLPAVALFRVWRQFLYACRRGWSWVWREPRWWWQCLGGIARCLRARRALAWPRYRAWMGLVRQPILSEAEWNGKIPGDTGVTAEPGFAVAMMGARMHYAVPRLLHSAGRLERFYTDICAVKGWPRLLRALPQSWQPPGLRRLLGRVPHGITSSRITAFTSFGLEYSRRRSAARTPTESTAIHLWAGKTFCELVIRAGLGGAAGVYAFNSAGLELLAHARAHGLKTALEQTIAPTETEARLLAREAAAHPGWEPEAVRNEHEAELAERERAEWNLADVILCGSDFVRRGIAECGGPEGRCTVVPYGVDAAAFSAAAREPHDGPLRVLTVGAVGLRKGSPYVLAAARQLHGRAVFRMAGATGSLSPRALEELRAHVELCGVVPRAAIFRHYEWADVFLLPSVCEGSATATYEALAAGLPVIATPNTGAHLAEGESGFTVPVGGADAIIGKLEMLAANRTLLRDMSRHARRQSETLSLDAYGRRLDAALTTVAG